MRTFLCSLLVVLFAAPAPAREWHARQGGFSVKAELVDLRDGSVFLKRDDNGQEVVVPLDKLSLEDVRFVHAELARLTNAIKGSSPVEMNRTEAATRSPFKPPRTPTKSAPPSSASSVVAAPEKDLDNYPSMPASGAKAPPLPVAGQLNWQAAPDPSPYDYRLVESVQVNAAAPNESYSLHPKFAEHPSHFVFFEESSKNFSAFHLPTQRLVGELKFDEYGLRNVEYSPDGRYLAVSARNKDTHQMEVQVWSFVTGKLVHSFAPDGTTRLITAVRFAGSDRIVIACSGDRLISCFDIATGRKISEASLPLFTNDESLAISPGGSYAAIFSSLDKNARLIDLRNGVEAGVVGGKSELPASSSLKQISFSPDGEELLVYSTAGGGRHLATWDMSSGKRLLDLNFQEDPSKSLSQSSSYRDRPLEWRHDRSGWLITGGALVERGSADIVWIDRSQGGPGFSHESRRFVDNDRLLVFSNANDRRMRMSLLTISAEDIAANRALLAKGATAADHGLPPLTPIADAEVEEIETSIQWNYQPDVAPQVAAKSMTSKLRISAPLLQLGHVYQCRSSNRVLIGLREPEESRRLHGLSTIEEQYFDLMDLATGKPMQRTSIPFPTLLKAVAPTGDWAAFVTKESKDRVDLFDLTTGKPAVAFRPFASGGDKIGALAFGSDRTMLWVLSEAGELTQWKLPECRALARRNYGRSTRLQSSPSGSTLCVIAPSQTELLDADSGKMLGTLASPTDEQVSGYGHVAFSDDGRQLASCRFSTSGPQHVVLWNLTDNRVEKTFEIPFKPSFVAWGSADVLLIRVMHDGKSKVVIADHLAAVHLPSERVVWNYLMPHGAFGSLGSDGRQWYAASALTRADSTLVAAEMPSQAEQESFRDLRPVAPLLTRGDAIAIKVDAEVPSLDLQRKDLSKDLQEGYVAKALLSGYQPDPDAEYVLSVEVSEKLTPDTLRLRVLGQLYIESVQVTEVTGRLRLADRNGNVVWLEEIREKTNANSARRGLPRGMKAADFLRLQQWHSVVEWLFKTPIPATFFEPSSADAAGISVLTPEGIDVRKPMTKSNDKPADQAI
ncbi:SHD1 domain-containing protein [Blastopirellula marina]|uniref:WD-40 repeat protein n=1 Tax=Blastopirellula marina DSM 3645 TaxID=314230 RepID=A3ZLU3_9BACT|nr:SHD1 domain-containing protein [Blastopirellula marina]EAQ82726.1 WD-40 repeat protein [Blastopirellula marina DSM 3645]